MKLKELLHKIDHIAIKWKDTEITGLAEDSREVKPGYLFFAVKGFETDGHKYISNAIKKGAVAVIGTDREILKSFSEKNVSTVLVKNIRDTMGQISHTFFGKPSEKITLIGITGTNGKTTTAFLIYKALRNLKINAGYIGTLGFYETDNFESLERTTPAPIKLNKLLKKLVDKNCKFAVLEVSSHALSLKRVEGLKFKVGIFTNLSQDHLDFYKDMYDYFLAKYDFLNHIADDGYFLTNTDNFYGKVIYGFKKLYNFSIKSFGKNGNIKIENIQYTNNKMESSIFIKGKKEILETELFGEYNNYNLAAAFGTLTLLDIPVNDIKKSLKDIEIPGRLEKVAENVFIDYAHTPDGIENLLKTLKRRFEDKKITVIFGCGGDRDKAKRPLMGKIATEIADKVIITSDNPRTEDPEKIIEDILKGCKNLEKVKIIANRKEAIHFAIENRKKDEVIVVTGKGHETTQEVKGKKYPFDEKKIILEAEAEINGK